MKGIYINAEQWAQIVEDYNQLMKRSVDLKHESDCLLSYLKAENRRDLDAYYIHRACRGAVLAGSVIDIREHIKKRYL